MNLKNDKFDSEKLGTWLQVKGTVMCALKILLLTSEIFSMSRMKTSLIVQKFKQMKDLLNYTSVLP